MLNQEAFLERALVEEGRLDPQQLESAKRHAQDRDVDLVDALIATDVLSGQEIALTRAGICEVPFVELPHLEPNYANTRLVPRSLAERHCLFPLFLLDGVLTLAIDDPLNLEALDQVRQSAKCEIDTVIADRERLRTLIARAYSLSRQGQPGEADVERPVDVHETDESQPVVAAVNQLLADAAEQNASDVHISPDEYDLRLRYRIDGVLHEKQGPPLSMHSGIVQRLKVMANLDLTQSRRPQDGKFRFFHQGEPVEVRLSTVPTICGENVVIRLLARTQGIHDFHDLGIPARMAGELDDMISRPYGMVLVTGPTGSGKTTTLYTAINQLNDPSRNIMTIEDPVEIRLPYIRQIQVHTEIGLTFASALRSILRQDPDVVLLGEIRDEETATIALQAALTGHLVLSTLHTNDAPGGVARLRDFGLPPFVINSSVLGIMAQRLVRRVCQHCAKPDAGDALVVSRFGLEEPLQGFMKGAGCGRCGQTGYRGRVGIYELLQFSPEIQALVERGGTTRQIMELAVSEGMRPMWQDGLEKARVGQTTLDEVNRAAAVTHVGEGEALRLSA